MPKRFFILILCLQFGNFSAFANPGRGMCIAPSNDITDGLKDIHSLNDQLKYLEQPNPNSPFAVACSSRGSQLNKPGIHFMQRAIPVSDSQTVKAHDFMGLLLKRLERGAVENVNTSKNIQFCMSAKGTTPGCQDMRKSWIDADGGLKFTIEEARYHLALATAPQDRVTAMGAKGTGVNWRMSTPGIYKEVPWKPLTSEEKETAKTMVKSYETQIRTGMLNQRIPTDQYQWRTQLQGDMKDIRQQHWEKYRDRLREMPLMQFISSPNPDDAEIAAAAGQQGALAQEELNQIRGWQAGLEKQGVNEKIDPALLQALDYRTLVEEVLLTHPEYCSIAAGLIEGRDQRSLGNTAMVVGPLLIASAVLPPLAGVAVGVAAGGGFALASYSDFQQARLMALSEIVAEKGAPDPSELDDLQQTYIQNATIGMAVNVVGEGGLGKAVEATRSAKIFSRVMSLAPKAPAKSLSAAFRNTVFGQ